MIVWITGWREQHCFEKEKNKVIMKGELKMRDTENVM